MDAMVSARIPVAVKERAGVILQDIGATPSQLINAAYDYLLAHHELPGAKEAHEIPKNTHRTLSKEQKEKVKNSLKAMCLGPSTDNRPFKERLAEARDERYAYLDRH